MYFLHLLTNILTKFQKDLKHLTLPQSLSGRWDWVGDDQHWSDDGVGPVASQCWELLLPVLNRNEFPLNHSYFLIGLALSGNCVENTGSHVSPSTLLALA